MKQAGNQMAIRLPNMHEDTPCRKHQFPYITSASVQYDSRGNKHPFILQQTTSVSTKPTSRWDPYSTSTCPWLLRRPIWLIHQPSLLVSRWNRSTCSSNWLLLLWEKPLRKLCCISSALPITLLRVWCRSLYNLKSKFVVS